MENSRVSRRRFILMALAASGVASTSRLFLSGGAAWAETGEQSELARLARLLLPHAGLSDSVYASVADSVFSSLAANPSTAQLIDTAETALDAQQDGDWVDSSVAAQVDAIRSIQGEAYFAAILATVRGAFYYHPDVWKHIDYPGSSKEHGGYKNRGFNDIAWLPEVN